MGKVAKVFGVGVKGELEVMLERDSFDAGETVEGVVVLRISKPVQCRELVLLVEGVEKVKWWEGAAESASEHKRTNDILKDKIVLSTQEMFEPGEYDFHFRCRLREDLPASFLLKRRENYYMYDIDASISYTLRASLPVTTGFSADLEAIRPIEVFAQRLAHPVNSVEASASKIIKKLGLVSKGECTISAVMDQDAMVAGETLLVQTAINNSTRSDMSNITLTLYEDMTIDVPKRDVYTGKEKLARVKMSGMRAGEQLDQVLSLPLVTKDGQPVTPATNATFVSWTHRLVIACKFSMSSKLEVTLPVVVLPRDRPVDAVAAATAVIATLEVVDKADVPKAVVYKALDQ